MLSHLFTCSFFFFNDTATTEIYTLSLHDALPISSPVGSVLGEVTFGTERVPEESELTAYLGEGGLLFLTVGQDRKSTRLNSSHGYISYAVFCLKKKKNKKI